ncbi:MAG: hypothetical protein LBC70_08185 [Chitinispirillales bacterium]|jgi:predicted component of type VI protein secretion system|nr:hypothetical protein [Chitinispirillales bacterium]
MANLKKVSGRLGVCLCAITAAFSACEKTPNTAATETRLITKLNSALTAGRTINAPERSMTQQIKDVKTAYLKQNAATGSLVTLLV